MKPKVYKWHYFATLLKSANNLVERGHIAGKLSAVLLLFMLINICSLTMALGQTSTDRKVTGKVTDAKGETLPSVSIKVKGSQVGTTTDVNGNYSITAPDNGTLVFSYVSFTIQEVAVGGRSIINIKLLESQTVLSDVVVVGFGTRKRENLIGSVGQVTAKQLENRPVTQLSNALAGQMSGVTVIQRSAQPGSSGSTINVRGVGSFGATSGALVIVDGIPGSLDDIDPNDVETISVLKDASSAAIYGSRAANGVILVTTKTGKAERTQVTFNSYAGFQQPTAFPEYANSADFATYYNEASGTTAYTAADIQKYRDGSDPDNHADVNVVKEIFSKHGLQTGHNLSINSAASSIKYNLSLGYLFQDGLVKKNDANRYNIRLNTTKDISSRLSLTTQLSAIKSNVNEPALPAPLVSHDLLGLSSLAVRALPIYAGRLTNGDFGTGPIGNGTPLAWIEGAHFFNSSALNLNGSIRLDYKMTDDLKLSFVSGYNNVANNSKQYLATQALNATRILGPSQLTINNNSTEYYTIQGLAEYTKQFQKHQIGVLAGYSYEASNYTFLEGFRDKFPGNELTELNTGSSDNQQARGNSNQFRLESQFARVNYNYANKYLVEGIIRRDGSSRFPVDSKYAYFPSGAIGYRIGQEHFIKDNFSFINELKLKASIGILGNQNIPNYPYQNTYSVGTAYNYPFSSVISSGASRITITDPNLHWESTRTTDFGLEMTAFQNKLTFSATYFNRYTYDILYSPNTSVSNTLGFSLSKQNTGKLSNRGWEFTAGYNSKIGNFNYFVNGNFTITNNKVLDLGIGNILQPNGLVGNGSSLFNGYPMQLYYGYKADGLFVDQADINSYASQVGVNPASKPGDIRYQDLSGPNGVPDGKVDATYDRAYLGSNIPKYTFGFNFGANYKGFDFSILLQGIADVKNYMNAYAGFAFYVTGNIQQWQIDERWRAQSPDRNAKYPRLEVIANANNPNILMSSFWTLNGAYLRGKNIQIGYTLPKSLSNRVKTSSIRIFATGENIFTIDSYRKGWDPEVANDANLNDDSNSVINNGTFYPLLRNFTLGLNVKF